jgi:hypothetical protein
MAMATVMDTIMRPNLLVVQNNCFGTGLLPWLDFMTLFILQS